MSGNELSLKDIIDIVVDDIPDAESLIKSLYQSQIEREMFIVKWIFVALLAVCYLVFVYGYGNFVGNVVQVAFAISIAGIIGFCFVSLYRAAARRRELIIALGLYKRLHPLGVSFKNQRRSS